MATVDDTINTILSARDVVLQDTLEKSAKLEARRESIKDDAYGRPLTDNELAELKDINSALGSLVSAHSDLMLMTVQALNKSDEVTRFSHVLDAANTDLKAKLKDVQSIAQTITQVNDLLTKLTTVITGLTQLLALLP